MDELFDRVRRTLSLPVNDSALAAAWRIWTDPRLPSYDEWYLKDLLGAGEVEVEKFAAAVATTRDLILAEVPLGTSSSRKIVKAVASLNEKGMDAEKRLDDLLTPGDRRRMRLYMKALSKLMVLEPSAVSFKEDVLGRFLTVEETVWWVRSLAVRMLPLEAFTKLSIPVVDHAVTNVIEMPDHATDTCTWHLDVVGEPGANPAQVVARGQIDPPGSFSIGDDDLPFWPGSLLESVFDIAAFLADRYAVAITNAYQVLLTGALTTLAPLHTGGKAPEVRYSMGTSIPGLDWTRGWLRFEFEPWISKRSLSNAYATVQKSMLGQRGKASEDDTLAIFEFSLDRLATNMNWRDVAREWNRENPLAAFPEGNLDDFKETFDRAWQTIVSFPFVNEDEEQV